MKKILLIGLIGVVVTGCTATRVVTTSATYTQHGDTTTTITTRTTETYRGEKN